MCTTNEVKSSIQMILKYLDPYWEFVNCHMVNYFTDNYWTRFVPLSLRRDIGDVSNVGLCMEEVFWQRSNCTRFAEVQNFINESKKYRLENMCRLHTSVKELHFALGIKGVENSLSIKEFLTEKKRHEVELMADLVNNLIVHYKEIEGADIHVVDAGDGKGYLSSRLALQYQHNVLGIDVNPTNSNGAIERSRKLRRAWNGLTERAGLEKLGFTPPRRGKKYKSSTTNIPNGDVYKTVNGFITSDMNLSELVQHTFHLPPTTKVAACLTGLHTCGNLAPTCLKAFVNQADVRILCNVGCCYHLLKEEFLDDEPFANGDMKSLQTDIGFPMSRFLQASQLKLGRNARMLAAQSIHRMEYSKTLPSKSLFYRALFEMLITETHPEKRNTVHVGKIKRFGDFEDYVQQCCKNTQLNLENISIENIRQVELEYSKQERFLELFYLIRMTFAPILESLILLDRLLYLKECGNVRNYLVPLFDPVVSPRRFCIVALK